MSDYLGDARYAAWAADLGYNEWTETPVAICGWRLRDDQGRPTINWWYDPPRYRTKCYQHSIVGRDMVWRESLALWRCKRPGCDASKTPDEVVAEPQNEYAREYRAEMERLWDESERTGISPWVVPDQELDHPDVVAWRARQWRAFIDERRGVAA